jgi:hypothetical protein
LRPRGLISAQARAALVGRGVDDADADAIADAADDLAIGRLADIERRARGIGDGAAALGEGRRGRQAGCERSGQKAEAGWRS